MKKIIINVLIICFLTLMCLIAWTYYSRNKNVTRDEFLQAHEVLNTKLDSLERISNKISLKTDSINDNVLDIKMSVDTLKRGQSIIFDQVKKASTSFWEMF